MKRTTESTTTSTTRSKQTTVTKKRTTKSSSSSSSSGQRQQQQKITGGGSRQHNREEDDNEDELTKSKNELLRDVEEKWKELSEIQKQDELERRDLKKRNTVINSNLIVERCLDPSIDWKSMKQEELAEHVLKVTHLRLDRLELKQIDNLECYSFVTHCYFQYNELTEISDQFMFMPNLKFLVMFNNQISTVADELTMCTELEVLDLSNNQISSIDVNSLPKSLVVLNLQGNPICEDEEIMNSFLVHLPKLIELNEVPVTKPMRQSQVFTPVPKETEEVDHMIDLRESFESLTADKLRNNSQAGYLSSRPSSAQSSGRETPSVHHSLDLDTKKEYFHRNLVQPEEVEQQRQYNNIMYQELLLSAKSSQVQMQQIFLDEVEQLVHEMKEKRDKMLAESRRRRAEMRAKWEEQKQKLSQEEPGGITSTETEAPSNE